MFRLWHHFPSFQDEMMKLVSSSDIRDCLDRRGVPYTAYPQPSQVDVTECFDEASEIGSLVLDMMTQVWKLRETASAELRAEVLEYLASVSEKNGDRFIVSNGGEAIVVIKPLE